MEANQDSRLPAPAMAVAIRGRCSCEVRVGRWGFPGRRAAGRDWVPGWHWGCCLGFGISIAPRSLAALSLRFIYYLGVSPQCKTCQPAAVVWKGQVSVARLSWCAHRACLSARRTGLPCCGRAISSASGDSRTCCVASVNAALLRWLCHEQPRGRAEGPCTVPPGQADLLRGGGSPAGLGPGRTLAILGV